MHRNSGVLLHISSLFSEYSCGSFGDNAKYFIDFLSDCGFTYWQTLPFCMVDDYNSPYQSYSAFGGNPYFIDLDILNKKHLISDELLNKSRQNTPYECEFERLKEERYKVLSVAAENCTYKEKVETFIDYNPYLKQVCQFMALKEANSNKPWNEWETSTLDNKTLFMWKFIQYEFINQWMGIKEYANSKGIKIIGDIPIYVSYDSADVWGNKEIFILDEKNLPKKIAGVPPDYFCPDGQLWGNPLYDWDKISQNNFKWWQDRIGYALTLFDGVRLDHFRGFAEFWAVDYGEKTAKNGKWVKGPGKCFIDAIKSVSEDKLIIGEDLGDITQDVYELLEYSEFPGMRVVQFGFLSDGDSTHKPHNYPENCVAYTGTHDNNTLLGYIWECTESQRKELFEYCGYVGDNWDHGYETILRTMFASHASILILPIQDLLRYGSDTRLNTPGRAEGNWSYRITKEQLNEIDKSKFKRLNQLYYRK